MFFGELLIVVSRVHGSTITIKLPHVIMYACPNFGVHDLHVQIPKKKILSSFILIQNEKLLIRQKLILKFYLKNLRLNLKNILKSVKLCFLVNFDIIINYIFPKNVIEIHQVSQKI